MAKRKNEHKIVIEIERAETKLEDGSNHSPISRPRTPLKKAKDKCLRIIVTIQITQG